MYSHFSRFSRSSGNPVVQSFGFRSHSKFLAMILNYHLKHSSPPPKAFDLSFLIAGSLESANSSILAAWRLFKDFGGEKIRILC